MLRLFVELKQVLIILCIPDAFQTLNLQLPEGAQLFLSCLFVADEAESILNFDLDGSLDVFVKFDDLDDS